MIRRLRKNHPIGYCVAAEVIFLAVILLVSLVVTVGLVLVLDDLSGVEDYLVTAVQEAAGILVAVLLLKTTGRLSLLRRRGSGFFNGLLVGMYPVAIIGYNLYSRLLFGLPQDMPLRAGWRIASYVVGLSLVGVAEEFIFRAVIGQTLLEHFGTSRSGIWKACILSGVLFGAAHLTNLAGSAAFGVLMQCVFAASLGVMLTAIYYRTGNIWVVAFIHAAMDLTSMLAGGLYGTESVAESVSGYDATMLFSVLIYLLPTLFLLRKKKLGEVALYFGRDIPAEKRA